MSRGFGIDPPTLSDTADALIRAASTMESAGSTSVASDGAGDAAALLADILAVAADVGARLSVEAQTLGQTVSECMAGYSTTDAAQAEAYLLSGETP